MEDLVTTLLFVDLAWRSGLARRMLRVQEEVINWRSFSIRTGILAGRGGGYRRLLFPGDFQEPHGGDHDDPMD